jgi:hypothetical protein
MFLSMLNEAQKKAFLALAARYVAEDGLVERNEMGWMDGLKREMGMDQRTRAGDEAPEGMFPLFDSRSSQVIAMLEIIRLGYVDGEHSPAESAFVTRMAQAFGLPPELLHQVDGWAARHAALTREAVELMLGRKCGEPK